MNNSRKSKDKLIKDLNAAQREIAIQKALDRIRKRALAMKTTEDIGSVVVETRDALVDLGIQSERVTITLVDEASDTVTNLAASEGSRRAGPVQSTLSELRKAGSHFGQPRPRGKQWSVVRFTKRTWAPEVRKYWRALRHPVPEEWVYQIVEKTAYPHYYHTFYFSGGRITIGLDRELDRGELAIARRVTKTFDFAYKRFLDLQQKEAQNRELTIQNALERVRAKAQGMQESSELKDVATALRDEFVNLGYEINCADITVVNEEAGTSEHWIANTWDQKRTVFAEPYTLTLERAHYRNWKAGKKTWIVQHDREQMAKAMRHNSEKHGKSKADIDARLATLPDVPFSNFIHFGPGWISFIAAEAWNDDTMAVAVRFADVFSGAYSRFKELKEKEAQNRELTIQNALERVRVAALAMKSSSDLEKAGRKVFEELERLALPLRGGGFSIVDESPSPPELKAWGITATGAIWREAPVPVTHPAIQEIYKSWKRQDDTHHFVLAGEALRDYLGFLEDLGFPMEWSEQEEGHFTRATFAHGTLFCATPRPLSDENLNVLRRFRDIFAFAYTRYLELQATEQRAREAEIEAALERVRVTALAMKSSSDLEKAGQKVFEELKRLALPLRGGGFSIVDESPNPPVAKIWGISAKGAIWRGFPVPLTHPVMQDMYKSWKRQDDTHHSMFAGEALWDYLGFLEDLGHPIEWPEQEEGHLTRATFPHGTLFCTTTRPLSDENVNVLRRFRDVFAFAYTRYLDLQKAEAQAKAAARQSAVDRVRAEIATMRTSADLEQVTPLIWKELTGLGVPFLRCGVFIVDEEAERTRIYLTNPRGKSLAALDLPFGSHPFMDRLLDAWYGKRVHAEEWDRAVFLEWVAFLQAQGQAVERERYQDGEAPPERLVLQCVPFLHGMLYLGSAEPLEEEDIALIQSLAAAFSVAYARYLDFRKLEQQNHALEAANEEVREATRLKSQFLATMSHELRTPMNAIIGFTRLVLRRANNLEDRQRENLEKVRLSADHLLNLINDILDLSKVEAGRVDVEPSAFDVRPLLEHCCATVGPTLGKPNVALTCEIEDAVGEVFTDESRLRQIVINLLSNALKFTDQGEVKVEARIQETGDRRQEGGGAEAGGMLEIAVSDTGIGIPEDQLGTIFEEFRQVDGSSTRRHQGTGLGLTITKRLIQLLGGDIGVESEVGKGSAFKFWIPVHFQEAAPSPAKASGDGNAASDRVIVSIDDDPNVAVLLRQVLKKDGFRVISAQDADQGIALVKKHRPVAVTMDILMPGKDGWQAIGMLKDDPQTRDIPIIVLSAIENKSLGLAMGVKDYLVKPVDRDALLKALGRVDHGSVKDVLVVDDEPSAADLLTQILSEEGLASRRAANGIEALDRISERMPDAILLDLMMPEMDGFEVIAKLQNDPVWRDIPIIVVTAKDLESDERTYLAKHVEKVVQKGRLDPSRLAQVVRDAVGE